MLNDDLARRRSEFFSNVWNHAEDPFQVQFDDRRPLTRTERTLIQQAAELVHSTSEDAQLGRQVFLLVNGSHERLALLLQICGLTRNKIISDLRAAALYVEHSVAFPSSYFSLSTNQAAWILAGPYLAKRLRSVLASLSPEVVLDAAEALNQATWPGYIRQERAKRSGHEGEHRLAVLLAACSIPFQPEAKADNPICPDATVHNVSFDIVVPSVAKPRVCFKATIHTANIGQYGESKDHLEIMEARQVLSESFAQEDRPVLVALIDGIGFSSNRAGLDGVLNTADEFCQFRTIWKSIVVCSALTGIRVVVELSRTDIDQWHDFLKRYDFLRSVVAREDCQRTGRRIPAGDAEILLDASPSQ